MRGRLLIAGMAGLVALVNCTPDPLIIPVRNLERPADMVFACVEKVVPDSGAEAYVTARPMSVCHDPEGKAYYTDDPTSSVYTPERAKKDYQRSRSWRDPRIYGTFGLVSNTARGEVAVVDFDADRLVDLAPATPGYNQVPVGALPEAIAISNDGCSAITANRGTCDLSVLDLSQLLAGRFGVEGTTAKTGVPVAAGVRIKGDSGVLRAQPREVAFLPRPIPETCSVGTGGAIPAGEVVVTFPSCSLIAIVGLPDGKITSSVRVLTDGSVVNAGTDPVCPVECGGGTERDGGMPPQPGLAAQEIDASVADEDAAADASTPGDAADPDAGDSGVALAGPLDLGPGNPALPLPADRAALAGLAIMPDSSKLYVGMAKAPIVVSVDLRAFDRVSGDVVRAAHQLVPRGAGGRLTLAEGAVGVNRVRLSVDPFLTPTGGRFVGTRGEFLYAFARDGSVRVVDIGSDAPASGRECDVNADLIKTPNLASSGCIPLDAPHDRKLFAQGPGLRLPPVTSEVAPAVPIDIAFGEAQSLATGFLLVSTGQVLHVGLGAANFPFKAITQKEAPTDPTLTHNLRRAPVGFAQSLAGDAPTVNTEPTRNFSNTDVPFATKVSFASHFDGPRIEGFPLAYSVGATPSTVWSYFPRDTVPVESIALIWQGPLSGAARANGVLEAGSQGVGTVGGLSDVGADFCRAGVRVGDIVSLTGCEQDVQCDVLRDQVCHHSAPGAPGVCVPRPFITDEAKVQACRSEFASRRRYEVKEARAHHLVLGMKLDEVPRPGVFPCNPDVPLDTVCQPDAAHKADPRLRDDRGFSCQRVTAGGPPRCLKSCGVKGDDNVVRPSNDLCRPGHVCADVGALGGPLCVEAPPPLSECLLGDMQYQVQVGRGFAFRSGSAPAFATEVEAPTPSGTAPNPAGGLCQPVSNLNPRLIDRVSLDAPACASGPVETPPSGPAMANFVLADLPGPSNPCLFNAYNTDGSGGDKAWKALVEGPDQRFVLTNIDSYVGDAAIIELSVTAGFMPLRVLPTRSGADVALGVRILTSPMVPTYPGDTGTTVVNDEPVPPYIFVIDQGRTLSDLSRGQLLRMNTRGVSSYPGGYFDSLSTDTLFPIQ
jgi:hypothetical protein